MILDVTWANALLAVGLVITLLSVTGAGMGTIVQWRFNALQHQLDDRMTLFSRETAQLEKRIIKLENSK